MDKSDQPIDRVLVRTIVDENNGCWIYMGSRAVSGGYGVLTVHQLRYRAHRVTYEHFIGPIPEGLVLDHLCHSADNECPGGKECPHTACVNPDHLEAVTQAENARRGHKGDPSKYGTYERAKTHCKWGHPYNEENTRVRQGKRYCRLCEKRKYAVMRQRKGLITRRPPEHFNDYTPEARLDGRTIVVRSTMPLKEATCQ